MVDHPHLVIPSRDTKKVIIMIFVVITAMLLTHKDSIAHANLCQVYPSEYSYNFASVISVESTSANCRMYPRSLKVDVFTEQFIHCNGTQLKLTDSNLGSEQYINSDYYVWSASTSHCQLLFIFPTRVNLTTITLHYYSDSVQGLSRLRFFVVPDDFDVWDQPVAAYRYVEVAAVSPGGEPAGRRNVSIEFNFNTMKVLLVKFGSAFAFAVSEVEFSICTNIKYNATDVSTIALNTITTENVIGDVSMYSGTTPSIQNTVAITTGQTKLNCEPGSHFSDNQGRTTALSSIAITLAVLFIVSLTINMIGLAVWLYKTRDKNAKVSRFEIKGNPCYEATEMKQTDYAEAQCHVYEMVQEKKRQTIDV